MSKITRDTRLRLNLQFFGGRGAAANQRKGIQLRPRKRNYGAPVLGQLLATDVGKALGKKGEPSSIADALRKVNPNYDSRLDAQEAYTSNCQRCIVAYEMQRRGYDVEALPTYADDNLPQIAYRYTNKEGKQELIGRWQGAFKNAKGVNVGASGNNAASEKKTYDNIVKEMTKYGNGSRAVVQILYRNGGGHVFNVENVNGQISFVEAQTGRTKDIWRTLKSVNTDTVRLVRTDNLKVSGRINRFVLKRNK